MEIVGFQKLTLLDYPGNISCTIFTGGCNFRCPFCHNAALVVQDHKNMIAEAEIFEYLKKRKNILDSICISGGEPLIQKDIVLFIKKLKGTGLKIKLDTNGSNPKLLKELIDAKLIDFVAMDIKNSKEKYNKTIGVSGYDIKNIEESVKVLLEGKVDYEFRTTVVSEFHDQDDFKKIAEWIKGCKKYVLQQFVNSGNLIQDGLHAHTSEELDEYKVILEKVINNVEIRGL